jgi:hypothetical protein
MNLPTSSKIININYIESHEQFKKKWVAYYFWQLL